MAKDKFGPRIKKALLSQGVVAEARLDDALAISDKENKSFTAVLVEKNYIDEKSLICALATDSGLPPISVDRISADKDATAVVNQEQANLYGILPVSKIGNILTIAVANPYDVLKLDELRTSSSCDLRPVVSTQAAIKQVIDRIYNPQKALADQEKAMAAATGEKKKQEKGFDIGQKGLEDDIGLDALTLSDDSGASDSPVIKEVNTMIARALHNKASDIHIEPYENKIIVRYRQDGVLLEQKSPEKAMHNAIISRIKIMSDLDIAERRLPQDGKFQIRYEGRQVDFRVSILPMVFGEKAVLRVLDSSSLNLGLGQLGWEPEVEKAFRNCLGASYGMCLVTGPTGSGKSTTLYAALKETLNPEENVVTVEDPVEYQLEGVNQVPVNAKRGLTFAAALRSILRQDPDIVMIGEIRDAETAHIAAEAALTGHLVFSTLHTNDSASAITRYVDMGIDPFIVSAAVLCISAQRLGRKLCQKCRQPLDSKEIPPKEDLIQLGFKESDFTKDMQIFKPVGCSACTQGYKGRFSIIELLVMNDEIRGLTIAHKSAMDIKKVALQKYNMISLRRSAVLNVLKGKTTLEEVYRNTVAD